MVQKKLKEQQEIAARRRDKIAERLKATNEARSLIMQEVESSLEADKTI